ncbi:hypothetical protein THASP1DRAFT_19553 [Thamnocephalis sphaerospora]|uniref:FAD-binding FR-type domain-containing protein n=1 Tax=Thamnocephalis sphaerospora TaxID=78915 RepID=A0A4V1IVY1_9FUNG|nr:hypothetical protein THASP1DRAFT_19553 [Thamnocephalis sphaerospora]|eukprot:RKP05639.1 hypothetical protein THASP1DRAFT_19553 [Thamnocephalis sphaerospora]
MPEQFCSLPLTDVAQLTDDTYLYTFALARPIAQPDSAVWSVWVKDDTLQAARRYTPVNVPDTADAPISHLQLAVRVYPDGQVSRFLWRKRIGDHVELCGPKLTWKYQAQKHRHVLLLAGGTGVTPMLQLLHYALRDPSDSTRFTLVYAARSDQDHMLSADLDRLQQQHPERLRLRYLAERVTQSGSNKKDGRGWQGGTGRITQDEVEHAATWPEEQQRASLVVLCGPDGMMHALAGRKRTDADPGPVNGLLARMGYRDDQVVKL